MTPDFKEAPISQIPALRLLQQLGYGYLSPEEVAVERRGRLGRVLLEDTLARQLQRLNRVSFKGKEVPFSQENIAKAIEALRDLPFEGLVRTSEKVYDLLTLGKSLDQTIDGETKGFTLRYIDWENPWNNTFHVTAEYDVERTGSHETRRPDIVCFVNGIPFVVIECKRPDVKHSLEEAVKQNLRNQQEDEIPQLFIHSQLLIALNKNDGSYATTGTPLKFWAKWREMHEVRDSVRSAVNLPLRPDEHAKLFKGLFAFAKEEIEEQAMHGREPTGQDLLLWSLCRPERLIELARQFIIYDEGGAVKKIARYQQYFAIRSTLERVRQRDPLGRRKGGVIWQTQGSGKSLAMVLLGKALALEKGIPNARVVIVTDRIDLDEQIWKTFHQCGKEPQQAKTGAHLIQLLKDDRAGVITTLIQKFGAAAKESKSFTIEDENLFVLVDESHRSHYGEANILMQKALPKSCYIGFTGTPLMKEEKSTAKKFGGFIDPAYTIRDAVEDEAVVPLLYEGRHVMQEVNRKAIDPMFEAMCEGLTKEQKADLKRKFAARDELNRLHSRLYLIAWDVSQHFSKQWSGTGFKGQLTAPGKKEALLLKSFLDQFGKVTSEVIISGLGEIENPEEHRQPEQDESVELFWKAMMAKYGSEKEYNRRIIDAFKKGEEPEILIVVDKLLTGFDAPRNVVLYIARGLKEHNLLQAIARVNRLHPGKDYGYIIDYYGVVTQLHDALELYGSLDGKFDAEDLEGTLTDLTEELKKLPGYHDLVWDLFKAVPNKKDEEAFELALEAKDVRDDFYTRLSRFSRVLKMALSSIRWISDTPRDKVERYKQDAAFFQKLRASVKLRYAEEIDYRDYEKQIQKMLNTYVQADEILQIVEPVNIFEREAFQAEVDRAQSPRAKADTIANRTKKTITEKMDEDPFFYRKFSALLQQAIDDYKAQRITDAEYLKRVTEIMEQIRDGKSQEAPDILKERDLSRALFGALKEKMNPGARADSPSSSVLREDPVEYRVSRPAPPDPIEQVLAGAACDMEDIIRKHAVVRWRENVDAQNRMRNDLDDFLFRLQKEKGIPMSYEQMDAIIEAVITIAIHRSDDV
ncbi:type I restriction endonuclease subunit R [Luteolibacter flavescens]|uniref:Type I restriction enzyme endonuclease subunit n=1 Tax=Luteolibacter flavescens TaxID=1859460 RepID=A0ABT3FHP2_9BACT|nr:type I restriction endonuclease subunit R [Luteolibacter flavescens]MCW1883098.1 type I restriction endonuclease subunit R [Luteolibacter flavescens]